MQTAHEKYLICNTLVGIMKECVGKRVQIDLRNEMHVYGQVVSVFGEMNVMLRDACFISPSNALKLSMGETSEPSSKLFNEITIRGRNIRFVHVPDEIDMISALQRQIFNLGRKKNAGTKNEFKKRPRNNNN